MLGLGLRHSGRKRDQGVAVVADILGGHQPGSLQAPSGLRDHRPDQIGYQLAHQFGAAPVVIENGIMPGDLGDHFRRQRHHLEIVDR